MESGTVLLPSVAGTSAMTLFSYLVSESKNRNFREPEVLGQLIQRMPKGFLKEHAQFAGWFIHYAIGVIFMVFYNELWKQKRIQPSLTSGAVLGGVSGLAGIIGWKGMFEVHPNPPTKNLKSFFGHLMLAHVVFGIFCSLVYKQYVAKKLRITTKPTTHFAKPFS